MRWLIVAISLICASSPALAASCASAFETQTLNRIAEDPYLQPLAREWLRWNRRISALSPREPSASDENFLMVTHQYLFFVADFLNRREVRGNHPENNPYLKFLNNLFEARWRGIDTDGAVRATSRFLRRFMADDGAVMTQVMVDAVQRELVPEMARLEIALASRKGGLSRDEIGRPDDERERISESQQDVGTPQSGERGQVEASDENDQSEQTANLLKRINPFEQNGQPAQGSNASDQPDQSGKTNKNAKSNQNGKNDNK